LKPTQIIFLLLCTVLLQSYAVEPVDSPTEPATGETVILIHGLLRTKASMHRLEKSLLSHGYQVINLNYPLRKMPVERLAEERLAFVIAHYCDTSAKKIHFVTHSIGGIILRYYLKEHDLPNLGRVVMICPPNLGTELVDRHRDNYFFRVMNGPAGLQMGTDSASLPLRLGPANFELGVIAGSRSLNLLNSRLLPGPDDGVIAVEQTKVAGMTDFHVFPSNHTFIVMRKKVIEQAIHFLQYGIFKSSPPRLRNRRGP